MQLTDREKQYLQCLVRHMRFEEITVELGMTREELGKFGTNLLNRVLEEVEAGVPLAPPIRSIKILRKKKRLGFENP
jgi:hypothetical protein